jgi:hypothetical protein
MWEKVKRSVRTIRFDQADSSSTGQTTRDTAISTCNATIVEFERVGIFQLVWNTEQQGQSKQFRLFPPHAVEWLVLVRLAYSLRQIKPLCREWVSRKHVTPLISLAWLASADQAFRGARSCLMHANRLGARDTQSWNS